MVYASSEQNQLPLPKLIANECKLHIQIFESLPIGNIIYQPLHDLIHYYLVAYKSDNYKSVGRSTMWS